MIQLFTYDTHKIFLTIIKRSITDIESTVQCQSILVRLKRLIIQYSLNYIVYPAFIKFQIKLCHALQDLF